MKRYGNLYERITSFENLLLASRKAQKCKRFKRSTAHFNFNLENELLRLQEELLSYRYAPGKYREFYIYERKRRKISAAPYRDRVIHHALCNIIEPIFEKIFIYDSYACRKGKGTHSAVDRFTTFARRNKYVLKFDIRKYFPSIDHAILFEKIRKKIKCSDTLWLIRKIIDSSNLQEGVLMYFDGDDIFTPYERRRGIPIGNLTSQFFANIYLNDFDHFVKEILKCRDYIRYVDDVVIFNDDKKLLWDIMDKCRKFLEKERLKVHPIKCRVIPVNTGVDFLGYRAFPSHRLMRKDISMRFQKKLRNMARRYGKGKISRQEIDASVQSWLGHARHADTFGLRKKMFSSVVFTRGNSV